MRCRASWLLSAAFTLLGCQLASGLSELHGESRPVDNLSLDTGCASDADCAEEAPRCLNESCVGVDIAARFICQRGQTLKPQTLVYRLHVVEFVTRMAPKNLVVKACRATDVRCDVPVDVYTDDDESGFARLSLPVGFLGFFEVESDLLPTVLHVTKPIVDSTDNRDLPLLSADSVAALGTLANAQLASGTGLVVLNAVDCAERPVGGIEVKIHAVQATRFYVVDMLPDTKAELTVYDETNNTADGVFVSVPPGFVTFSVHWGVDGVDLQSFNAMVRADWVTFIDMMF